MPSLLTSLMTWSTRSPSNKELFYNLAPKRPLKFGLWNGGIYFVAPQTHSTSLVPPQTTNMSWWPSLLRRHCEFILISPICLDALEVMLSPTMTVRVTSLIKKVFQSPGHKGSKEWPRLAMWVGGPRWWEIGEMSWIWKMEDSRRMVNTNLRIFLALASWHREWSWIAHSHPLLAASHVDHATNFLHFLERNCWIWPCHQSYLQKRLSSLKMWLIIEIQLKG